MRLLLLAALQWLVPAASGAPAPSASREVEAKVALENSLERRVESVLREVLGTQDVVVIVNAEMISDAERKAVEIMPGVPPKEYSPAAAPLAVAPTLVRKLSATLFVSKDMPEPDRNLARRTVERLLGVPEGSGAVAIEATLFRRPQVLPTGRELYAWILPAAWLLFALLAFMLFYARFLSPLLGVLRETTAALKERGEPAYPLGALPGPESPANPARTLEGPQPIHALGKEHGHFGFIHERDLPALGFLLSRDPTSSAIVLNYLPPGLAARFLDQLPASVRQETAALMSQTRLLNKHQVTMIEEGLRERLQYLMGGESRLIEILDSANAQVQQELLSSLRERDPEAAERVARRIVMLDDLALMDATELRTLSRQVTVRSLAAVLAASPDLKDRVVPKLSGGVGDWLLQEVDLCDTLSPATIEAEQRRVLTALSQAVREGRVILRRREDEGQRQEAALEAATTPIEVESAPPSEGEGPGPKEAS